MIMGNASSPVCGDEPILLPLISLDTAAGPNRPVPDWHRIVSRNVRCRNRTEAEAPVAEPAGGASTAVFGLG
jgi:hypothetical protein